MNKITVLSSSYRTDKYLKEFINSAASQTFKDFKIALESVDTTKKELKILNKSNKKYDFLDVKTYDEKISLPKAWNNSINRTESEFICIWNVDDLRTKESLEKTVNVFSNSKNIDFVYGNFTTVNKFKKTRGNYIDVSGREGELKKSMILGPFFMFRRKIIDKIGLFDEQLISAADFDFAMRLARNSEGKHLNYNLGYYLNDRTGLSTKHGSLNELERTVVELRYGLNIINSSKVSEAENSYNTSKILNNNIFVEI